MANTITLMFIAMLMYCTNNILVLAWNEPSKEVIHVGGKVMCQDCSQGWKEWVNGDKPIKGAKVSLTCWDQRKRAVYYTSDTTDVSGLYDMTVDKYVNGKELDVQGCYLRLVSSPDDVCNILTDFGGGKSGFKLNKPISVYRNLIKYVADTFYYTTPMCDMPETDKSYGSEAKEPRGQREGGYY